MSYYYGIAPHVFAQRQISSKDYFSLSEVEQQAFIWYFLRNEPSVNLQDGPASSKISIPERVEYIASLYQGGGAEQTDILSLSVRRQLTGLMDSLIPQGVRGNVSPDGIDIQHARSLCQLAIRQGVTSEALDAFVVLGNWSCEHPTDDDLLELTLQASLRANEYYHEDVPRLFNRVLRSGRSSLPAKETALIGMAAVCPRKIENFLPFVQRELTKMDAVRLARGCAQHQYGTEMLARLCVFGQEYYVSRFEQKLRDVYQTEKTLPSDCLAEFDRVLTRSRAFKKHRDAEQKKGWHP